MNRDIAGGESAPPIASLPGRFLTLEGGEGAGKTTQRTRLVEALARCRVDGRPLEVVATREPGGAPGAEAVRRLLVEGAVDRWAPRTEALLHAAARHDHLTRTIRPALARGAWVVCDRFADSTRAYQGHGLGLPLADLEVLNAFVCQGLEPDLTVILDLPPPDGLARTTTRGTTRAIAGVASPPPAEDRYERFDGGFHNRVRAGFLAVAEAHPRRCQVVDARPGIDAVHEAVFALVLDRFPELERS